MKTINNFDQLGLVELNSKEITLEGGGIIRDFFFSLGATSHEIWNYLKENEAKYANVHVIK